MSGRKACDALAAATDEWLAALLLDAADGDVGGLALVAAGGYGRKELAPWSDLDVWLLHTGRPDVGALASRIWYPIWDAGLKLGHGVFTAKEALTLAANDLDTATSALSLRPIAGDPSVSDGLAERAVAQWRKRGGRWLADLDRRVQARHVAAGEVAFLLEPNIKEGRGGLRDVHALVWAGHARSVLENGDASALHEAEDVLLDARVALHRLVNKPSDELLLERQDGVATALGLANSEALMARVSASARTVAWVSDEAWRRVRSSLAGPVGRVFRRDREVDDGLVLRDGSISVQADVDIANDPTIVLRAASVAAREQAIIDRQSLDRLAAEAPLLEGTWPAAARDALVAVLATGHAAIPVLESLDQRRLLERLLPEWTPLRSRPQRNALHVYTVDRHLCEAAAQAAKLTRRVARPDLLLVGAWLHDIGKGYPGDHTDVGIGLVSRIGERMGFAPEDVEILMAMVRNHLLLPDVATRRDLADADVITAVAEQVGSLAVLELLAALTEADSIATGPTAWSAWKAELVDELVERVAAVLRGETSAARGRREDFPNAEVRALMAAGRTTVRFEPPEITVVGPDRPGMFSRVAGTLALNSLTVLAAEAASDAGTAASRFRVESEVEVDWQRVSEQITQALDGRLAIEARMSQRRASHRRAMRSQVLGREPSVRIDNHASASATVIEVHAPDRIGVLYRITRALADLDLDIRSAKVATLGEEVVDSFYVRTASGAKVVDRDHQREVERAILYQVGL
ncbi:MAG: glnD [Actinomycetia bacterium]|nr:glnD [Actinomycetes bacterium]